MPQKSGFGIIGCGRVAPRHATSIKQLPDVELIAVADLIESRAAHFAKEYSAHAYTDYHELLARDDIDVVNIYTPSGTHVDIGIDVAKAGKHIIVEKPIALSTKDANRLIDAADEADVKLCVVLQNRYNPPMLDIYDAVYSGKIGKPLLGNATVRWYRPQSYYEDGWHGT